MKLGFIVQRYGKEVVGGAEAYCRLLAEKLKDLFEVEVLTSCAVDYMTWDNYYKPGLEYVNGVKVRRFATDRNRDIEKFNKLFAQIVTHEIQDQSVQEKWMEEQGPYVPQLVEYIKQNEKEYNHFVFFSYLYYHTCFGIRLFPEKSVLIPMAHDEPTIYFNIFKEVFNLPKGIIYLTPEEKNFVNKRFNNSEIYNGVIGIGIEQFDVLNPEEFLKKNNIDYPYILYAGRIDASKGCDELFDFFLRYKFIFNNNLKLLLIGKEVLKIPEHRDIVFLGFLSEKDKYCAMSSALASVIPSCYESYSFSVLESFMCGKPVLVNEKSEVLKGHCLRSEAGLYYSNYRDFGNHLNNFINDTNLAVNMGKKGRDYVLRQYNWKVILDKYLDFINLLDKAEAQDVKIIKENTNKNPAEIDEDLLIKDQDDLNQELVKVREEWDVTILDISQKEKGFRKLTAFIYRKLLKKILRPYFDRFLLKQARFNSSVVRCLNYIKSNKLLINSLTKNLHTLNRNVVVLMNETKVISENIRNNNRRIAAMHKQINKNSDWLYLIRMKNETQTDELQRLTKDVENNHEIMKKFEAKIKEYDDKIDKSKSSDI